MGLPPQLKLLADFIHKSGHGNMSEECNNICPYSKVEHTQFHSGMDTHKAYVSCLSVVMVSVHIDKRVHIFCNQPPYHDMLYNT